MSTMIFAIGGKQYNTLPIIGFNLNADVVDGEGTGRTKAEGLPMFRDPAGTFKNFNIEIGLMNNSSNSEFLDLLSKLDNFGVVGFQTVTFLTPSGPITQEMYATSYKLALKTITKSGVTYWGTLSINFIAEKAIIV